MTMKRILTGTVAAAVLLRIVFSFPASRSELLHAQPGEQPASKGDYFGQTPPGPRAERFHAGGFLADEEDERRSFNVAFSPDGDEVFFSYYRGTEEQPHPEYEIKTFKRVDDAWVGPLTASFSGRFSDVDINNSPDGRYVFFASDRPQPRSASLDIYYAVRTEDGWSAPIYADRLRVKDRQE